MRVLIVLLVIFSFSCKPKQTSESKETLAEDGLSGSDCVYRIPKKGIQETRPFNQEDSVVLVSFGSSGRAPLVLEDGALKHPVFLNKVNLNDQQKADLFEILFHYRQKDSNKFPAIRDCYEPRHAIIFYEEKQPIAFYEICFECENRRISEYMGDWCEGKLGMLEKFFQKSGFTI